MADQNKIQQTRRAGSAGFPVTEFPSPPQAFVEDPIMRAAWNRWMAELNEWRKNIPSGNQAVAGGTRIINQTTIIQGGGGDGTQDDGSEPQLKSLYLMTWMGM